MHKCARTSWKRTSTHFIASACICAQIFIKSKTLVHKIVIDKPYKILWRSELWLRRYLQNKTTLVQPFIFYLFCKFSKFDQWDALAFAKLRFEFLHVLPLSNKTSQYIDDKNNNKLGLSCVKLSTAWASYPLAISLS